MRQETETTGSVVIAASVLTAGRKATVVTATRPVRQQHVDALLATIGRSGVPLARLEEFGTALGQLLLPPMIREVLPSLTDHHLLKTVHQSGLG